MLNGNYFFQETSNVHGQLRFITSANSYPTGVAATICMVVVTRIDPSVIGYPLLGTNNWNCTAISL
jgi:hypothetical protein